MISQEEQILEAIKKNPYFVVTVHYEELDAIILMETVGKNNVYPIMTFTIKIITNKSYMFGNSQWAMCN